MAAARFVSALRRVWVGAENSQVEQQSLASAKIKFRGFLKASEVGHLDQSRVGIKAPPVDGDVQQYDFSNLIDSPDNPAAAGFNKKRVFSELLDSNSK